MGLGGRIVFLFCFWVYYHVLSQEHPEQKIKSPYFIVRVILRECVYVFFALINSFIALFILSLFNYLGGVITSKDGHFRERSHGNFGSKKKGMANPERIWMAL